VRVDHDESKENAREAHSTLWSAEQASHEAMERATKSSKEHREPGELHGADEAFQACAHL
jgi:hypothetical protein